MRRRTRDDREAGFTLAETLVVVSIATVLAATVMAWSPGAADTLQGDANQRVVAGQLINAREIAINQRRSVEVRFIQPNIVQVWRHDLPAGTTLMSSATLEDNTQFLRFPTLPDTPDGFGGTGALAFGNASPVMFTADNRFTDSLGNPVNGSIFLGRTGRTATARSLTIFGMTARVHSYRWAGSSWGK